MSQMKSVYYQVQCLLKTHPLELLQNQPVTKEVTYNQLEPGLLIMTKIRQILISESGISKRSITALV